MALPCRATLFFAELLALADEPGFWSPALAGAVGLGSLASGLPTCALSALAMVLPLGMLVLATGYTRERSPSPEYVYWLPYTSWSTMYLPSFFEVPIFLITPSFTAITGEPALAKMLMPLRFALDSMSWAALWFTPTFLAALATDMSSA